MNDNGSHPDERKLMALNDGELDPGEAAEVREHCEACEACRRTLDEFTSVTGTLRGEPAAEPRRPAWPAVSAQLERGRRPILRPAFAATAAAAVAAGVLAGVLLGSTGEAPAAERGTSLWSAVGSSFEEGGVSDAYVRMSTGEGG